MKKLIKRLLFLSIIMIAITLSVIKLYSTYATGETQTPDHTFTFNLTGDTIVNVDALSSKMVYYQITNTNPGTVRYGVGYSSQNNNVIVKAYENSDDSYTGLINEGATKTVKLKVINNSNTNASVELKTILGYENGGNLIVPEGTAMVNSLIYNTNTLTNTGASNAATGTFLETDLIKNTIESITFVGDNIPSADALGSFNMCSDTGRADAIKLWYTDNDENSLYEVYIGSDNGIVTFPSNSKNLFCNLTNMTNIDFSAYINTSNASTMEYMFLQCSSLTELDLSSFNTSSVTNMLAMFRGCNNLTQINFNSFNTENVTTMAQMFWDCDSLVSINLSNFDTRKVSAMNHMFYNCNNLEYINIGNFETPLLSTIKNMFSYSIKLKKIDMSNFDFSGVTDYTMPFTSVPTTADIVVKDCTQYNLLITGSGRTDGIRTITNMSTNCPSS